MKILIFTNTTWNVYNFRYGLIDYLKKKNHDVCVLSNWDIYKKNLDKLGINTHNVNLNRNSKNIFKEILVLFKIYYKIKYIKPDIILNFTIKPVIYGSILSRLMNIKTINTITGMGTVFTKNNQLGYLYKVIYQTSQKKVNKIIFQNESDLNYFIKNKITNNLKNFDLISGSGINLENYQVLDFENNQKIIFYYVGRLIKDKGIIEYIKASEIIIRKYKNVQFNILGNFDRNSNNNIEEKIIDNWVKKKQFKYYQFNIDIKRHIKKSNCIILPSYREGLSRILLEACSFGRPIITTDVPGCRELVKVAENGFLCKSRNIDSLVQVIENFLNLNINEQINMGLKGRKMIEEKFSDKKIFDQYYKIIKNI